MYGWNRALKAAGRAPLEAGVGGTKEYTKSMKVDGDSVVATWPDHHVAAIDVLPALVLHGTSESSTNHTKQVAMKCPSRETRMQTPQGHEIKLNGKKEPPGLIFAAGKQSQDQGANSPGRHQQRSSNIKPYLRKNASKLADGSIDAKISQDELYAKRNSMIQEQGGIVPKGPKQKQSTPR